MNAWFGRFFIQEGMDVKPKRKNIFGAEVTYLAADTIAERNVVGYFDPTTSQIVFDKSLTGQEKIHTILHEEFHAVLYRLGIYSSRLPEGVEEIICEGLSRWIAENYRLTAKKR